MGILENIKILEAKIDKEIFIAKQLMEENGQLTEEQEQLKEKITLYEKRIEELEALITAYKEEKQAIASGILSALNRLNEFDDTVGHKRSPISETPETPENSEEPEQGEEAAPDSPMDGETPEADPEGAAPEPEAAKSGQ